MKPTDDVAVSVDRVGGQLHGVRLRACAVIENDDGRFAVEAAPVGWFLRGGGIEAGGGPRRSHGTREPCSGSP